jgi:site-specific DNA recombinase
MEKKLIENSGIKYFLYARKSSESEDRQMASIEDQIKEMYALAERHGIEIVDVIQEAKSAKKPGRPGFNQMVERIHKGEATGIICWKANRLARNPVDAGQISWMLQQSVIKHIQTFTSQYKPTDNVLILQIEFGVANQFIKDLSTDTKRGQRNKAKRGWYPAAHLPPGYKHKHLQSTDGTVRIDPQEEIIPHPEMFNLVRDLWRKMLTGEYSVPDLKREGDRIGVRNKKGAPYSLTNYRAMFTNEFYCGYFYWGNEDGIEERIKGNHIAMITEDEYNRVQKLLGKRGKPTRINKYHYPYRGTLHCGVCQRSITAEQKVQLRCTNCHFKFSIKRATRCPKCGTDIGSMKKPHIIDRIYYRCVGATKGACLQRSAVEQGDLEKLVRHEVGNVGIPRNFYLWAVEAVKHLNERENSEQTQLVETLRRKENALTQTLDGYVRMRANQEISAEQLARYTGETERDLAAVRAELTKLHARLIDWAQIANEYLTFAEKAVSTFEEGGIETRKTILRALGSNQTLTDKKLRIIVPKTYSAIKKANQTYENVMQGLEPEKALDNQGLFRGNHPLTSTLLPG